MEQINNEYLNTYIDDLIFLLDLVSKNNFSSPKLISYSEKWYLGTPGIDISMETLKGVRALIKAEDYVDAYVLIRKIRDNIFFDCVLILDAETNHYKGEEISFDSLMNRNNGEVNEERLMEAIIKLIYFNAKYEENDEYKKRLVQWQKNKNKDQSWLGYHEFKMRLEQDELIKEINSKYLNNELKFLQKTTNAYVHSLTFAHLNNKGLSKKEHINTIFILLRIIKFILISYLMVIRSRIFTGSYYVDYYESNKMPCVGLQYLLHPIVLDALDELKEYNANLYQFLKVNNSNDMVFER